jgi:hypothetical protein
MFENKILGETNFENNDWIASRKRIKSRFSKLPDAVIDDLKDNEGALTEKLQTVYGYSRIRANREVATFKILFSQAEDDNSSLKTQMSGIPYFDSFFLILNR